MHCSATRITISRSGFGTGEDWAAILESATNGIDESIADLVLYLETGVSFARHPVQVCYPGLWGRGAHGGLLVESVIDDTFAERLGLRSGDVIVELDGAAVFGNRELMFFARTHEPGDFGRAVWVRNGELQRGHAELSTRP